jgi:VanZ family protein
LELKKQHKQIAKHIYFAPAYVWGIFITILSLLPGEDIPDPLKNMNDKIIHSSIYFLLAILIFLGLSRYTLKYSTKRAYLWFIVVGCSLYGGIIELLQLYVISNRSGDWHDFWSNTIGSAVGVLLFSLLTRRAKA